MRVLRSGRSLALICTLMVTVVLPPLVSNAYPRNAGATRLDTADASLPQPIAAAIIVALDRRPAGIVDGKLFRVTSAQLEQDWALVSVAALDGAERDPHAPQLGSAGVLVVVSRSTDGSWQAALDGTLAFADLAARAPERLIAADAKRILGVKLSHPHGSERAAAKSSPSVNAAAAAHQVDYKFPWAAGQAWGWWQGWHYSAHDLGTNSKDRRVLASAEGTITSVYRCKLSAIVDVKHADGAVFRYIHLDKRSVNTKRIRVGAAVQQGQVLGNIKPNTWKDGRCGYTRQGKGWAHLHWVIPSNRTVTVDGWTIRYPHNTWSKHGKRIIPGYGSASTLVSTNEPQS